MKRSPEIYEHSNQYESLKIFTTQISYFYTSVYDIYKYRPEEDNPAGIIFSQKTLILLVERKSQNWSE